MRRSLRPLLFLGLLTLVTTACGGSAPNVGALGGTVSTGLAIVPDAATDAERGTPYELVMGTTGGAGTQFTWRLVGGSLPPGLGFTTGDACPAYDPFVDAGTVEPAALGGVLGEISGLALSRRNPGVHWVHDDSGAPADLYAIDAAGTIRQQYHLDVVAVDWEDLALGPGPDPDKEYLYVADVGDNGSSRTDVRILRVEEPLVPATGGGTLPLAHEIFYFAYPGGPRDCETLLIDWATGTPYLVEKSDEGADAYRFPMPLDPTWTAANPVTLVAVTSGGPLPALLTAGDATRDGRRIALRSYGTLGYELLLPAGGSFEDLFEVTVCTFLFLRFQQYEALAYDPSGTTLTTTTEVPSFLTEAPIRKAGASFRGADLTLAGTATATGGYTFTVEVRDDIGGSAERTFTIDVE